MNTTYRWLAVGLLIATVGCNKGDPGVGSSGGGKDGGGAGGYGAAPAKAPTEATPDVVMNQFFQSLSTGDVASVWNALPASYQTDVTGLKNQFAGKMDADLWNKAFVIVGKAANLLKTKKELILANPEVAKFVTPENKSAIDQNWDALSSAVGTLAGSEIKTLDGLKATDPGRFLASTGTAIATSSMKAAKSADPGTAADLNSVGATKYTLVKQDGNKATLHRETPGQPPTDDEFVKVEGKWVPAEMADDWNNSIDEAKKKIDEIVIPADAKQGILGMMTQVETIVDSLSAAKDQAAFDAQVAGLKLMAGMLGFGGGGAMSGPPPGFPGGPGAPGGSPPSGGGPAFNLPLTPPTPVPPAPKTP